MLKFEEPFYLLSPLSKKAAAFRWRTLTTDHESLVVWLVRPTNNTTPGSLVRKEITAVRLVPGRSLPRGAYSETRDPFRCLRSWTSTQFSSASNGGRPEPEDFFSHIGGGNSKNVSLVACCDSSCPRGLPLQTETQTVGFLFVTQNITGHRSIAFITPAHFSSIEL